MLVAESPSTAPIWMYDQSRCYRQNPLPSTMCLEMKAVWQDGESAGACLRPQAKFQRREKGNRPQPQSRETGTLGRCRERNQTQAYRVHALHGGRCGCCVVKHGEGESRRRAWWTLASPLD